MSLRFYILFFVSAFIILAQFVITPNVINSNDLNGNIVPLLYFKESIIFQHKFPEWNPYIDQGIPAVADPLYGIFNPLISLPILLFHYQIAVKVMYLLAVFLAAVAMFTLARQFKIPEMISSIIAITYADSTYLTSRILAGHLEKVISFGFLPLFIFSLIKTFKEKNITWSGVCAVIITLILFSGDIYNALYCLYSIIAVFIFTIIKERKASIYLILTVVLFLIFSSIKILPMVELQNYISKIKEPFNGGLNILSFIYNLFLPADSFFLKFFPSQEFSTGYGWWESLSFIGPFSILGLYFLLKSGLKSTKEVSILIVLSILFLMLAMPGLKINPFHYLISFVGTLQYFHVPSRILALFSVVILTSFGLYLAKFKSRTIAIFILLVNLFILFLFSQNVLATRKFKTVHNTYTNVLSWIINNNTDNYYTVHETSQSEIPQDEAYLNHLLILQSNYGLFLKGSPAEKYNFKGENIYNDIKPGFIISSATLQNKELVKIKSFSKDLILYRNSEAKPFASIDGKAQKALFSVNKITINTSLNKGGRLLLLETNYPGWSAFQDGKLIKMINGRFLQVEAIPGNHQYEFSYSSRYFKLGLFTSLGSFAAWGFYVFNNSYVIRKKRTKKF